MGRKLDHTQLDVAVIRDHIMALPSNASDGSDEESINNVVAYIKKELEGLRILSRRIELHQAAEISALKEVSGMVAIAMCKLSKL